MGKAPRFLAATPKHPVILESLKDFKKWCPSRVRDGLGMIGQAKFFFFFSPQAIPEKARFVAWDEKLRRPN